MSTTINVTTPALPTTLTAPADGDAKNAASINTPFQSLLNGQAALGQRSAASSYNTWGDADVTMSAGQEWHQTAVTTIVRNITLDETTVVPTVGARIRAVPWSGGGFQSDFKREDGTSIARLSSAQLPIEFVWTGTVWVVSMVDSSSAWASLAFS